MKKIKLPGDVAYGTGIIIRDIKIKMAIIATH